ncbi:MAG TPA: Gldg family protein [Vicinamibacterales bacterium]|jgi:ABC-type uncharacterized transport system involved in gliding motility auxiliary subunit|nr:Gldg family protein [Vicinamibacterales bacterium]
MTRIFNALAWLGTAIVFAAAAVRILGWADVIPVSARLDQYAMYASWAGLALVVLYSLSQWRQIVAWFGGRNARYGTLAGVSVIVALGILVAVNYVSVRQNKRWDLTANQQFSLSDQTTKLLANLKAPVKFLVFEQATGLDRFRTRLSGYEYASKQVSAEYIDADKYPLRAKEYEIQQYGTVVVEYMGRKERVTTDAEQDLTNALIKVLNPTKKKIYFLAGHGEKDTASQTSDRAGFNAIAAALKLDNYEFDKLVLAQANEVPADATMLVIAGPRTDLSESEVPRLEGYLAKSGKLLVLLDPPDDLKGGNRTPRLTTLLAAWGIKATDTVVVDLSGRTNVATVAVVGPPYPMHAITERFDLLTVFPLARAITAETGAGEGRTPQPFLQTHQRSWAESTMSQLQDPNQLKPEEAKGDLPGPVTIGMAVAVPSKPPTPPSPEAAKTDQAPPPETRVAVIGDSDFASNAYLGGEGNRDLFMNVVGWLSQQENLISIRPREAADRRLTLTASQITGMFALSIFLVPGAILGAGVYSWWRRR